MHSTNSSETKVLKASQPSPVAPSTAREEHKDELHDTYDDYLELAYRVDDDEDPYAQDGQAGGNVGQEEEETTLPYVFTETPRVMYTVQARSYITPWQTVYKGCGRGCNVTGRTPGQLCQVRVRASAPGVVVRATSPWSLVNATTKEVPGSGLSLLEGLREKDGPQIRDALAQLAKYSQLERMDAVVSEIGRNPLGEAIAASRARGREGVAVLLERKAACDVRSAGANFTPVMLAAVFGCHDICSRLESAGACWNARDRPNGWSTPEATTLTAAVTTASPRSTWPDAAGTHSSPALRVTTQKGMQKETQEEEEEEGEEEKPTRRGKAAKERTAGLPRPRRSGGRRRRRRAVAAAPHRCTGTAPPGLPGRGPATSG
ncbi:uncharacterized protein LOC143024156 isoform X3 [Oratosquilla oratoria]|uniref:uncharacterized protein LOC143024156 isoform X3 n=1 Tax=Oratosquilla oratoria TaxID=337810 RepID=UPI003F7672E3